MYRNVSVNEVREVKRVEEGVDLHVVVEADVGIQLFSLPCPYAPGPLSQSGRRIAAHIKLFVPVKAGINKIGGDLFQVWPLASSIRHHESYIMIAEQFEEFGRPKGIVPDLHGMSQRPARIDTLVETQTNTMQSFACHGALPVSRPQSCPLVEA
jgi:hypothetical protein